MILDEKLIVCSLIDWIENEFKLSFIAREVPFLSNSRRADVVCGECESKSTIAFEIKSDRDSLKNLKEQLEDYRKTYNKVYVVTTEKYASDVRGFGSWFGICVAYPDGNVHLKRQPKAKINFVKDDILRSVGKSKIRPGENISDFYFYWLESKYNPLYEIFKKERTGQHTVVKDLPVLSLRSDRINLPL